MWSWGGGPSPSMGPGLLYCGVVRPLQWHLNMVDLIWAIAIVKCRAKKSVKILFNEKCRNILQAKQPFPLAQLPAYYFSKLNRNILCFFDNNVFIQGNWCFWTCHHAGHFVLLWHVRDHSRQLVILNTVCDHIEHLVFLWQVTMQGI